jgi:integrase
MVWLPNGRPLDARPSRLDDFALRVALAIAPFAMVDCHRARAGVADWHIIRARSDGYAAPAAIELNRDAASCVRRRRPCCGTVSDVTPHVLRHSFASIANDLGFTEVIIAALVGHAKGSVTSKYIHTLDTALIMAADTISGYIQGLLEASNSNKPPMRWTGMHARPPWLAS